MKHLGDFDLSAVLYGKFTTYRPSTGAAFTLGGTPALSVYKDNSTTQSTSGVTLTADFDAVTGLNHFAIDTSSDGTFYSAGSFFDVVITTGTVDGVSVVGSVVASFSLRKDSSLKPTTAGRTLDVSAGGEAGLDWANIGSPTTAQALSGTSTKALEPTTAGRTLDVSATGEAGLDFANIGAPAAGAVPVLGMIDNGTAQAATSTTLQLRSAAAFASSELVGAIIVITGGSTGVGQARSITAYNGSTDTATVDAWTTTPTGTITYAVFAAPPAPSSPPAVNVTQIDGVALDTHDAGSFPADVRLFGGTAGTFSGGRPEVNTTHVSGTSQTAGDIIADTNDIQARLPAALVSGRMDASVGAMAANVITAASTAADYVTEVQSGLATAANLATVAGYIDTEVQAIKDVTDKLDTTLQAQSGISGYRFSAEALSQAPSGGSTPAAIADAVWDEILAGHSGVGSTGAALAAAGGSGDPWSTALPGAYSAGTAGFAVGTYIDAAISAVKAKTDNLPSDPADASVIAGRFDTVDTSLSAINAKTTNLPSDPADESLIIAATDAIMTRLGAPAGASVSADVAAIQADTNDIQTRLPAALVSGRMDASVGAMAANVLTAAATAADYVTEVQSGLSTLNAAGVRTAIGMASANLDTQLGTLATAANLATVDTVVDAIKAKTDLLAFTSGNVHADIKAVIADPVQANGSTTTNWGGTP